MTYESGRIISAPNELHLPDVGDNSPPSLTDASHINSHVQRGPAYLEAGHQGGNNYSSDPAGSHERNSLSKLSWLRRPCLVVATVIKWIPVIFITAVIAWSYYAFVIQLCLFTVVSLGEKIPYLIIYHVILVLFVWSYWATIFAQPYQTPSSWKLSTAMLERLGNAKSEEDWKTLLELFVVEMEIPVVQRSIQGAIRYCDKCQSVKPDRSHHCSVCQACILKMDHHCPW